MFNTIIVLFPLYKVILHIFIIDNISHQGIRWKRGMFPNACCLWRQNL